MKSASQSLLGGRRHLGLLCPDEMVEFRVPSPRSIYTFPIRLAAQSDRILEVLTFPRLAE